MFAFLPFVCLKPFLPFPLFPLFVSESLSQTFATYDFCFVLFVETLAHLETYLVVRQTTLMVSHST